MTPTQIKARMQEIDREQAELERVARVENAGQFSADARARYEQLDREYAALKAQNGGGRISKPNSIAGTTTMPTSQLPELDSNGFPLDYEFTPNRGDVEEWVDQHSGQTVTCYSPTAKISKPSEANFGRYVRALVTGEWKHAPHEKFLALSEGGAGGGDRLVPEELSTQLIDMVRAQSVLVRAGMRTINMTSETLTLARIETDPSFTVVAENAEIGASDITIGSVQLVARKVGCIVTASKELMADAPNAASLIENALARALAVEVDRLGLVGNAGSDGVLGLITHENVGETTSTGAISWEELAEGVTSLRELNYEPRSIIWHPRISSDCRMLTTGDGTNASKGWLPAPPVLDGLQFLETTSIGTGSVAIGDFQYLLMGLRDRPTIQVSDVADEAFKRHQVKIKITQRFAYAVARAASFHVLRGVTT